MYSHRHCKRMMGAIGPKAKLIAPCFVGLVVGALLCVAGCEQREAENQPDETTPSTSKADDKVITLAADVWLPYNGLPGSENPGFIIEIAQYAFEREGYQVEYLIVPWARAIHNTRDGTYDGIVGTGLDETPDFIFPDHALGLAAHTFFVRQDSSWRFEGLASLEAVTLGVIRDYSYGTLYDDYIKTNQSDIHRIQTIGGEDALANNVAKLEAGRVDVMVEDRTVFGYHLYKIGKGHQFIEAGTYCDEKVYIAFSPAHPESKHYAEILTNAMKELRASGKLATMLAKYGVEDWKQ